MMFLKLWLPKIIEFIAEHYREIILILILCAVFYYKSCYEREKVAYEAFKREVAELAVKQEIKNAQIKKDQEKITQDIVVQWDKSNKSLKAYYENRNHVISNPNGVFECTNRGSLSDIPATASSVDATTESDRSNPNGTETVTVLDCASDVLQLLSLQKWINEQLLIN